MKFIIVVVVALLAIIATELAVTTWLAVGPSQWPMIERYWSITALPAIVLVVVTCTALLWPIYRRSTPRYALLFAAVYLIGMALELYLMNNALQTIGMYVLLSGLVCATVLGSAHRLNRASG